MICCHCYSVIDSSSIRCASCGKNPILAGRYRLEAEIGQEGSARTYRAIRLDDDYVLMVRQLVYRKDALRAYDLFEREIQALQRLTHPQIQLPRIVESFRVVDADESSFYVVQELFKGKTLAEVMKTKRFSERDVLQVLVGIADPLEYLHTLPEPIIHRDLKPAHMMLRPSGQVVLINLGVGDVFSPVGDGDGMVGTPGYMSPEQLSGEATLASDIFSLGMIAAVLLSGREWSSVDELLEHLPKLNISFGSQDLISGMLMDNPHRRPDIATVREIAQKLLADKRTMARAYNWPVWMSRRTVWGLAIVVVISLIVGEANHEQLRAAFVDSDALLERYRTEYDYSPSGRYKTLGLYTLGMTVADAQEASKGLMTRVGALNTATGLTEEGEVIEDHLGQLYRAPNVIHGSYAYCELGFLVDEKLSEINCSVAIADGAASDVAEDRDVWLPWFKERFGSRYVRRKRTSEVGDYWIDVWSNAERELTLLFGPATLLNSYITTYEGNSQKRMVYRLVLREHERVLAAAGEGQ